MRSAARRPGAPVAALALPLLTMTADALPLVAVRWLRLSWTGAAAALLVVKTAAAAAGRRSAVVTMARSGWSCGLMPAAVPAATKPFAAVTDIRGRGRCSAGLRF